MPVVHVNDIELFYERTGDGPAMLLVHGNGEDHTIFDRLIPLLASRYTVYAVDSRGHGRSSAVDSFDYGGMADDMVALIGALGLERPRFYGFSDGGIIGLMIAIRHPDLLSSLIVSGANVDPSGIRWIWRLPIRIQYRLTGDPKLKLMLEQPHIPCSDLACITIPTTVTVGSRDVVSLSHTRMIARCIPSCRLLLFPGESHGSYVIHSDKLSALLLEPS